ncbi:MAG: tail fiber domain-containing protein, partial [Terriglobia bacterium]
EDSRVLLVSVPYALKAEDAAMLGGRQASDFVLGEQLKEEVRTQVEAQKPALVTGAVEMLVSNPPKYPAIAEGPSTFTCAGGDCVTVTSTTGRALRAKATSAGETVLIEQNGTGYGLRALSVGNIALLGHVTGGSLTSYGVKGQTVANSGAGVFGYNQAGAGLAYGVLGQTTSPQGTAVFGRALSTIGGTVGLRGHADSTSGTGVVGQATATSGATTGILGRVFSAAGTALVVDNTKGGKLLSGQVNGTEKLSITGSGNLASAGTLAGTQLISTVAGGTAPLAVTSNTLVSNLNADLLDGFHAGGFATLGTNIFMGTQTIYGGLSLTDSNISLPENTSASEGVIILGGHRFIHACCATSQRNTFVGPYAGNFTTTGADNTAVGNWALFSNTVGYNNTASGSGALSSNYSGYNNTASGSGALASNLGGWGNTASGSGALLENSTGVDNTASGSSALSNNKTGSDNTAIGYWALHYNNYGNNNTALGAGADVGSIDLQYATAIGAGALVAQSNSLVLGGTGASAVNVGIGTAGPSNILTIVQNSATDPIADAWTTYSSRRWKTNIRALQGALDKVERLRGVSYDAKADGQHHIGLIAEEVGEVVPEVVAYEANGQDAKSVDYARLTALLIEAVKEQQAQIQTLKSEIERLTAKLEGGVETASR